MENNQLSPLLILDKYLSKKYLPGIKLVNDFIKYTASYFNTNKDCITLDYTSSDYEHNNLRRLSVKVELMNDNYYNYDFYEDRAVHISYFVKGFVCWREERSSFKSSFFIKLPKVNEFLHLFWKRDIIHGYHWVDNLYINHFKLYLYVDPFSKIKYELYDCNDDNNNIFLYSKHIDSDGEVQSFGKADGDGNKLSEEDICKILLSLKVDISEYRDNVQEEIRQFYLSSIGQLENDEEAKLKEFRELQINRIMLAYQKFKEIAELLNDTKMDLKFDRVKISDLKKIIFKNDGNPTENGYIEFDDFFKNNMLLRMLDLSQLDLTNVNITNMDFSGTNIHIDPQIIYNKDMTNVNAFGVEFSILDSFDGVILDGAKINDWNAMIYLEKLKSYNSSTIIRKGVLFNGKTI